MMSSSESMDNRFAEDDVVYADGSSAILGDVTAVDENGITVVWRATTTVEQPEDLVKVRVRAGESTAGAAMDRTSNEIAPASVPTDLVIEFHYADEANVGAYALEPGDSLLQAARSMWAQFSPNPASTPTHIVIRRALPTD